MSTDSPAIPPDSHHLNRKNNNDTMSDSILAKPSQNNPYHSSESHVWLPRDCNAGKGDCGRDMYRMTAWTLTLLTQSEVVLSWEIITWTWHRISSGRNRIRGLWHTKSKTNIDKKPRDKRREKKRKGKLPCTSNASLKTGLRACPVVGS